MVQNMQPQEEEQSRSLEDELLQCEPPPLCVIEEKYSIQRSLDRGNLVRIVESLAEQTVKELQQDAQIHKCYRTTAKLLNENKPVRKDQLKYDEFPLVLPFGEYCWNDVSIDDLQLAILHSIQHVHDQYRWYNVRIIFEKYIRAKIKQLIDEMASDNEAEESSEQLAPEPLLPIESTPQKSKPSQQVQRPQQPIKQQTPQQRKVAQQTRHEKTSRPSNSSELQELMAVRPTISGTSTAIQTPAPTLKRARYTGRIVDVTESARMQREQVSDTAPLHSHLNRIVAGGVACDKENNLKKSNRTYSRSCSAGQAHIAATQGRETGVQEEEDDDDECVIVFESS